MWCCAEMSITTKLTNRVVRLVYERMFPILTHSISQKILINDKFIAGNVKGPFIIDTSPEFKSYRNNVMIQIVIWLLND